MNWTPPLKNYRDFETEKPPPPIPGETQMQRLNRILRDMPPEIWKNPELRLKALAKANRGS